MMSSEKTLFHTFKCLFVINNVVFNAESIILHDLWTEVKIGCISVRKNSDYRILQVMASNEEAFLTLVVRKQSISTGGFVWMVLYVSSIVMILPSEVTPCVEGLHYLCN